MSAERPLRIALAGASGRMGGELVRLLGAEPERYRLVAAWVRSGSAAAGRDSGELAGTAPTGIPCSDVGTATGGLDVVIDFSAPDACGAVASAAAARHAALVCGTTGLGAGAAAALAAAANTVPVLAAENFSLGIAVLAELAELARRRLGRAFDAGILEVHHRGKRDAPSGTALMLGRRLENPQPSPRRGARGSDAPGYAVLRGGGVIGDHTVFFLGSHERLELTHRAGDRAVFAAGALAAAVWLAARAPGRYSLGDLLAAD